MAQHSLKYDGIQSPIKGSDADSKGLGYEKFGVIAGFLVGLPAAMVLVETPLTSAGAPQWIGILGVVFVVAVCTALGLRAGAALAKKAADA